MQAALFSQSRIDRIYASRKLVKTVREWKIESNPLEHTDHKIASVMIVNEAKVQHG